MCFEGGRLDQWPMLFLKSDLHCSTLEFKSESLDNEEALFL